MEAERPETASEAPEVYVDPSGSTTPIRETLGLRPFELLDDISCMAEHYCAEGFQAFDEAVTSCKIFEDEEIKHALQGSLQIFHVTLSKLRRELSSFENDAAGSTLHIPPHLSEPQAQNDQQTTASEEAEQKLDQQLVELRRRVLEAKAATRAAHSLANGIAKQLAVYGDPSSLQAVVNTVAAGKENLAEDAAAIAEKGRQLRPLLQDAEAIFAGRQQSRTVLGSQNVAALAEREAATRKAAANKGSTEEFQRFRQYISL